MIAWWMPKFSTYIIYGSLGGNIDNFDCTNIIFNKLKLRGYHPGMSDFIKDN